MTTAALIETLEPGELVIRCADGSLLRTMTGGFHAGRNRFAQDCVAHERRPVGVRKLMRRLTALKHGKKR